MTLDEIRAKIGILEANLDRLAQIPQATFEQFAADFRNLATTLHLLQTSIQVLIDLGNYNIARLGLSAPGTSLDVLARLEEAGRLPAGSTARFAPVIGFRNRVVHLYDRIDPEIVYRILVERRADLAELLRLLLAVLETDG